MDTEAEVFAGDAGGRVIADHVVLVGVGSVALRGDVCIGVADHVGLF